MITISFTTLFLLFLFFFGWKNRIDFDMWDLTERSADIRQKELLEKAEKKIKKLESSKDFDETKVSRRRAIKDRNGNVLIEEVILNGKFDIDEEDFDDFDDFDDDYDDDYDDDFDDDFDEDFDD